MPEQPTKDTLPLYVELPADLRERLNVFIRRTRRTLKGEVSNAIEQYLDREDSGAAVMAPVKPPPEPTPKRPRGRPKKKTGEG